MESLKENRVGVRALVWAALTRQIREWNGAMLSGSAERNKLWFFFGNTSFAAKCGNE